MQKETPLPPSAATEDISSVAAEELSSAAAEAIPSVVTEDISSVATDELTQTETNRPSSRKHRTVESRFVGYVRKQTCPKRS